ncbi:MAG: PAS domain-containing protein, partial [Gemmatimonadota bacterium]
MALRTSRRRLEALSEGVTIHDPDGMMVYANRAAEEILGLERSEMTTRAYFDPDWSIRTLDGERMAPEDLPAARAIEDGVAVR